MGEEDSSVTGSLIDHKIWDGPAFEDPRCGRICEKYGDMKKKRRSQVRQIPGIGFKITPYEQGVRKIRNQHWINAYNAFTVNRKF
jgi:hypothetical protein